MSVKANLTFKWETSTGKNKTQTKQKFEDVWHIEKVDDTGLMRIVSPNDDVFEMRCEDYVTANVLFHQYDETRDAAVTIYIGNQEIATYEVADMLEVRCWSDVRVKDFTVVLQLLNCYKGKQQAVL